MKISRKILFLLLLVAIVIFFRAAEEPFAAKKTSPRHYRASSSIEVRESPHIPPPYNLGVFATRPIKKGEVIERSPYTWGACADDGMVNSKNQFGIDGDICGIGMGFLSFYNHGEHPSLETEYDHKNRTVIQRATRNINVGEEILTSYGDEYWKGSKDKVAM